MVIQTKSVRGKSKDPRVFAAAKAVGDAINMISRGGISEIDGNEALELAMQKIMEALASNSRELHDFKVDVAAAAVKDGVAKQWSVRVKERLSHVSVGLKPGLNVTFQCPHRENTNLKNLLTSASLRICIQIQMNTTYDQLLWMFSNLKEHRIGLTESPHFYVGLYDSARLVDDDFELEPVEFKESDLEWARLKSAKTLARLDVHVLKDRNCLLFVDESSDCRAFGNIWEQDGKYILKDVNGRLVAAARVKPLEAQLSSSVDLGKSIPWRTHLQNAVKGQSSDLRLCSTGSQPRVSTNRENFKPASSGDTAYLPVNCSRTKETDEPRTAQKPREITATTAGRSAIPEVAIQFLTSATPQDTRGLHPYHPEPTRGPPSTTPATQRKEQQAIPVPVLILHSVPSPTPQSVLKSSGNHQSNSGSQSTSIRCESHSTGLYTPEESKSSGVPAASGSSVPVHKNEPYQTSSWLSKTKKGRWFDPVVTWVQGNFMQY